MTHRHAFRRGVAPRPSAADIRVWRRLLKRAAPIAANPQEHALSFVVAAEKANKAIAPVGHQNPGSAFVTLVRVGMGFLKLTAVQRVPEGERVRGLIAECRAALDALEGGAQHRLPYRED